VPLEAAWILAYSASILTKFITLKQKAKQTLGFFN
jgi:hypothetical protein